MNYWQHFMFSNAALVVFAIMCASLKWQWVSAFTLFSFMSASSYADTDLKLDMHRHWFFHSSAPCAILLGCLILVPVTSVRDIMGVAFFCMSHGVHLLCDIKIGRAGKRGTYLIYLVKRNRLSVKQTDACLFWHGLASACLSVALALVANI